MKRCHVHSKDAPEIDPTFLQPEAKTQAKGKDVTPVSSVDSNEKRLKQLRKKLDQIAKLKEKQDRGETLEQNQVCGKSLIYKHWNNVFVCF